ncbi:MAG: 2-octaprenyl-6-methoxyphenyl hydroxylase, partial [Stenotrophomonas sp.]
GFNLGLRDALTLAELIGDAVQDPGSEALLQAYVARRGPDREQTLAFSDGLARLTSNATPLIRPLRSLGFVAAAQAPAVQSYLVGGAMGFRGQVPELCRSEAR